MAYAVRRIPPGRPSRGLTSRRHVATVRSVNSEPVPAIASHAAWAGSLRRFARLAVWALPPAAAVLALVSLERVPTAFAEVVTSDWYRLSHAIGAAAAWLGLVGLVGLVALLAGTRGRGWATGGLLAGLGAAVLALPVHGLGAFARPALGWAYLRGDRAAALAVDASLDGTAVGTTVLAAALLAALACALVGIAVLRSGVLNRADGVLLLAAAPLVLAGATLASFLVTIGALLLLAAALGLAWTAARLSPTAGPARPS